MRIALVVPGGLDRSRRVRVIPVLLALVERLARRHQVLVVSLDRRSESTEYDLLGARVVNLGPRGGSARFLHGGSQLIRLLAAMSRAGGEFDVIHAFWVHPPGTLAVLAGSMLRVPVVVSVGGGEMVWLPSIGYGGQSRMVQRALLSTTLRMANVVTAPSAYAAEPVKRVRSQVRWVPTGVDLRIFEGCSRRSCQLPWRLLQVGGLNEVKDQATLLRALQLVVREQPEVVLDCIGVDTLNGRAQRLAADLNLEAFVRFRGVLTVEEIVPFYRAAHVFVQSSLHESMGAAVLEAAAAGVPTVGTKVGIVAEMAPDAAVAVAPNDPGALAAGILDLLRNCQRRGSLGRRTQEFSRNHDADWTCAQFEGIYSEVIAQ